jgi:hypothetical protein
LKKYAKLLKLIFPIKNPAASRPLHFGLPGYTSGGIAVAMLLLFLKTSGFQTFQDGNPLGKPRGFFCLK